MTDEINITTPTEETAPQIDYKAEYEKALKEIERYKNGISKTNSEISRLKKDIEDNLTKEQQAELERKAHDEEIARRLAEYEERERIHDYQTKLIAGGHDPETALIMAKALPAGVSDEYFETAKRSREEAIAKAKAELLNNQPTITPGTVPTPEDPFLAAMRKGARLNN